MKNKIRIILKSIVLPPKKIGIMVGIMSLVLVAIVLLTELRTTPFAYVAYALSAMGLYYLILHLVVPLIRRVTEKLHSIPLLKKYYGGDLFRARVILYRGTLINAIYAIFKLITGIWYHSTWFIAIAVFYLILILLKFTLVRQDIRMLKKKRDADLLLEWHDYRRTGWLMLLMNIGLSAINAHVIAQNQRYSYPGVIIYAIAFYAFYRITLAIIRMLKSAKNETPLFAAAKAIDLSFAVTAMFTLQTAMYASFSPDRDVRVQNLIGGSAVAVIVTGISMYMIIRGNRTIKEYEKENKTCS